MVSKKALNLFFNKQYFFLFNCFFVFLIASLSVFYILEVRMRHKNLKDYPTLWNYNQFSNYLWILNLQYNLLLDLAYLYLKRLLKALIFKANEI